MASCGCVAHARREAFRINRIAAQGECALDCVLKLAHIAGPVIVDERGHSLLFNCLFIMSLLARRSCYEMASEKRDVFTTLTKGRQMNLYDVQALEQVLAERAFCNF